MSWLLNIFKSGRARMPSEKALQLVKETTSKHKVCGERDGDLCVGALGLHRRAVVA